MILAAAWDLLARLLAPLLPFWLRYRLRRGKEIGPRLPERMGFGAARPKGRLFWLHAASVGETVSILPVLQAMAEQAPRLHFLFTTGTVTAARLLQERLPENMAARLQHRFVPLDVPGWVERFLHGWRPDAAAFVESELWPNLIRATAAQDVPMALVNARLSARSARWWRRVPGFARRILGAFRLVLAQSANDAARLRALGAPAQSLGNLKFAAPPLPARPEALASLQTLLAGRPVLVAASTHPGEEALVLALHQALEPMHPGLLTVIVPRHPERGAEIAALVPTGLTAARRSQGALPETGAQVYLADTLGELGLFYRLADLALMGGTLVPHGGQNPLEAVRLGCPVLVGPHHWNFEEPVQALLKAGLLRESATGSADLAATASAMLSHEPRGAALSARAAAVTAEMEGLPLRVAALLLEMLPPGNGSGADATGGHSWGSAS